LWLLQLHHVGHVGDNVEELATYINRTFKLYPS